MLGNQAKKTWQNELNGHARFVKAWLNRIKRVCNAWQIGMV